MPKNNQGQALLLVLLAVASILVVAMSVVSQSVSDIRVSTQEEESIRALNAAEAGIEQVLKMDALTSATGSVDIAQKESSYDIVVENFGAETEYLYPKQLMSGETATIWFKEHNSAGVFTGTGSFAPTSMRFCWGNPFTSGNFNNNPTVPALEVILFYNDGSGMKIKTLGYDPNNSRRTLRNWLATDGATRNGNNRCDFDGFQNTTYKDINFSSVGIAPSSLQFAVVKMLYNTGSEFVGVKVLSGGALPSQGRKIDSSGVSGVSTRRVEINLLYSDAPSPFTAAIVSKKGIGS